MQAEKMQMQMKIYEDEDADRQDLPANDRE